MNRRFSAEQIIHRLLNADVLMGQEIPIAGVVTLRW
jgi:hypothetical protein